MENVLIEKLGRTCYGEFVISPDSIPGCDVILGMPFMKGNRVKLGFDPDSHCVFPDNEVCLVGCQTVFQSPANP